MSTANQCSNVPLLKHDEQHKRIMCFYLAFLAMFVIGVVLLVFGDLVISEAMYGNDLAPPQSLEWSVESPPVRDITTREQFVAAINSKRAVIFVDHAFSCYCAFFRKVYQDTAESRGHFCGFCRPFQPVKFYRLPISGDGGPIIDLLNKWMMKNAIPSGGLKTMNGASRVIWIQDGKMVGYQWAMERELFKEENFIKRTCELFRAEKNR